MVDLLLDLAQQDDQQLIELGNFKDLEILTDYLNGAWESVDYRLEKMAGHEDLWLFIEDPVSADEYECGVVQVIDKKVYAISPAVYAMVMGAWKRYTDEFGTPE